MLFFYTTFEAEYLQNEDLSRLNYELETSFRIVGDEYGGCMRGQSCSSFEISYDRSYKYFENPAVNNAEEGKIPLKLWKEIKDNIIASDVRRAAIKRVGNCASQTDGIDYHFIVSLDGEIYNLDTCETQLAGDESLRRTLQFLFTYFADREFYEEEYKIKSLRDILEDTIQLRLVP